MKINPLPHQSARSSLSFQGKQATRLAQQTLLSDIPHYETLKKALKKDDTPYLGQLPLAFTLSGLLSQHQALQGLDGLTKALRAYQWQVPNIQDLPPKPPGQISLSSRLLLAMGQMHPADILWQKAGIEVLGEGGTGTVYKISLDGQPFVLKIVSPGWLTDTNDFIVFNEAANGLFFTAHKAKDMSDFYAANPYRGWLLTEYIGPNTDLSKRPGTSMKQLGYQLHDDKADNYIRGIRIDHGGIPIPVGFS